MYSQSQEYIGGIMTIEELLKKWKDLRFSLINSIHPIDITECRVLTKCIKELEDLKCIKKN